MTTTLTAEPTILSPQAKVVLGHRYFLKNDEGIPVENSSALFNRVAKAVASIDKTYFI